MLQPLPQLPLPNASTQAEEVPAASKELLPKVCGSCRAAPWRVDADEAAGCEPVQVLHVAQALLQEAVAMNPPSPATYSTPVGPPSRVTILLTSLHALYSQHPALQRYFVKSPVAPLIVSLTGGTMARQTPL